MKKLLMTLIIGTFALTVNAQFGFVLGLNVSTVGGEQWDHEDKKSLMGFNAGVFYNLKAGDNFSVQPELVYSGQGIMYKDGDFKEKYAFGYLNFTPVFRYNTPSGFFAGAGPQFGFRMCAEYQEDDEEDEDIREYIKGFDLGAAIMAGFDTESGVGFYARYNLGLTSVGEMDSWKGFNRVLQVGLRYTLKNKTKK